MFSCPCVGEQKEAKGHSHKKVSKAKSVAKEVTDIVISLFKEIIG